MPYKLDYALKNQKWKAVCNCLSIYNGPFYTWWNINYISHVKKWKETEKTPASQTWPKLFDTALHSTSKLVRRIRSFEKWVRSNPVALKPRSIAISLSRPYKCQRQTSSLSILGLEVQPCLSEPSRTCNVLISAVVRCSSFSATLTWRRGNASCGSLGSLADLYSRLKV